MIKQSIARILSIELDRKDFLKALGIGVIAATGVGAAVSSVVKHTASSSMPQQKISFGYGQSAYGGRSVSR